MVIMLPYRKVGALEACWYMICFKLKEALRMPKGTQHNEKRREKP